MITDEQVKQACAAYEKHRSLNVFSDNLHAMRKALEAYEQSKPKPEPVGFRVVVYVKDKIVSTAIFEDIKVAKVMADTFFNVNASAYYGVDSKGTRSEIQTLYTTPPTREPLSDNALANMLWKADSDELYDVTMRQFKAAARLIERAHGIGVNLT